MGGGGERGEQGTETAGRLDDREGDLGSGTGRGIRESRSGRRLGNIAVVLPPLWLRTMLHNDPFVPAIHSFSKNKTKLVTLILNLVTLVLTKE